jgi:hypothetical protein
VAAIWHDHGLPSFLGAGPRYSFFDVAEIVEVAPAEYEAARLQLQAWERKLGSGWYQHNAELAHAFYVRKKPWWL